MKKVFLMRKNKLFQQILNFGVVGVISTLLDYLLYLFLIRVCGINYLLGSTVSYTVGIVFNYWASMRYVFKSNKNFSKMNEFILYVLLNFLGLALNQLFLFISVSVLTFSPAVGKIFATILVMIYNFISRKLVFEA